MYMYFIYFYNASGFHFVSVFAMSFLKIEFFMAKQKEQDRALRYIVGRLGGRPFYAEADQ